ncbi:hypothetical protein [Pseudorhodoferax sp.]|uniref:hypothetical protein n=1 Tax=Pseudorhodoferax sp. TaxID=1993553 RepID=UPI002DD669B8|nr:hypothetical protein [Pseudorhodoferax sp.]
MGSKRSLVVVGLVALVVALAVAMVFAWWPRSGAVPAVVLAPAGMPRLQAGHEAPPLPPAVPRQAAAEAAEPEPGPVFDQRDLFALFAQALSSDDPAVLARGIAAWRACSVYYGPWGLDRWLQLSIPAGLAPAEHARRERHGRASAQRCAGFAGQTEAMAQADALVERARAAGDPQEQLRDALIQQVRAPQDGRVQAVTALACTVVRQQAEQPGALRWINPVLRQAAYRQPGHFLNTVSSEVASLAVTLALCDLNPQGCDAHSEFVLRACMRDGACHYAQAHDYWRDTAPADVQAAAQPLRTILVDKLRQADCATLFD